jgi:membrane-associated phospholipid phosphatase
VHRLTLVLSLAPALLAAQPSDTTRISTKPLFTIRDAIAAGAFLAAGAALYPADKHLAGQIRDSSLLQNHAVKDIAVGVRTIAEPGSLIIGGTLYAYGRLAHKPKAADLGLHGTEAILVGSAASYIIKGFVGRARPYVDSVNANPRDFKFGRGFRQGTDYSSFPSGHTTAAFAAAAAVTAETSRWWPNSTPYIGTVMYGGATLVGLSRMYDNKHWASDVIIGAAIGTFSGLKVVRYHHSHPSNRLDKWLLAGGIRSDGAGGRVVTLTIFPQ